MMTNEVNFLKGQYDRIGEMMNACKPGSTEYKELLNNQQSVFKSILEEEVRMAELELKEAEFELKEQELKKPIFKRFEFWSLIISGSFALRSIGKVIDAETGGAILNSKALGFVPKMRIFK